MAFSISISEVSAVTGDNTYANDSGNNNSTITNTTNYDNTQNSSPTPTSESNKTLTTASSNTTPTQKTNEDVADSSNNSAVTTSSSPTQELTYTESSVSALAAANSVNGTIVLTFDDGAESVYTYAYPIMQQYGIKGTVFVNPAFIGDDWYMTLAELQELHNAGWTVANHGNEHLDLTTLSRANKVSEVQTAINWLNSNGFGDGAYYFARPYGSYDDEVLDVLRQLGIKIHRTVEDGYITNPPADLLRLPDKEINGVDGYHTLAQAKSIVDGAISTNTTAIILLHEILPVIASGEDGELAVECKLILMD